MDTQQLGMYSTVTLDAEEWQKHVELERSRKIKGWREPQGFEWTYGGQQYGPVMPGEKISVPAVAAEHGVRESAVFPRLQDERGNELMALDHRGSRFPLLEVVETWHPGDPAKLGKIEIREEEYKCAFCRDTFADKASFAQHLNQDHGVGSVKVEGQRVSLKAPQEQDAA